MSCFHDYLSKCSNSKKTPLFPKNPGYELATAIAYINNMGGSRSIICHKIANSRAVKGLIFTKLFVL